LHGIALAIQETDLVRPATFLFVVMPILLGADLGLLAVPPAVSPCPVWPRGIVGPAFSIALSSGIGDGPSCATALYETAAPLHTARPIWLSKKGPSNTRHAPTDFCGFQSRISCIPGWLRTSWYKPKAQAFESYLAAHPGAIDLWLGGHTHTHPDDVLS
jgi:hypothetical protein